MNPTCQCYSVFRRCSRVPEIISKETSWFKLTVAGNAVLGFWASGEAENYGRKKRAKEGELDPCNRLKGTLPVI